MIYTIIASATAFVATNIDDLFINMLLYMRSSGKNEDTAITTGKFMGTALLLAISCLGAAGLQKLASEYLWLLGFVPVAMGIKEITGNKNNSENSDTTETSTASAFGTMFITLASGGDNIGIYLPLMAGFTLRQMAVCTVVFFIMTGLFCLGGKQLAHMPAIETATDKYRHVFVPAVYIILGLYIIFA
ncbi:MAG: cadmium resistance transporter [Oscillospiraceae bacterium]|nr:cadmium resistance transporter [Oscillospiraceae bacterium]